MRDRSYVKQYPTCGSYLLKKGKTHGSMNSIGGLFMSYLDYVNEHKKSMIEALMKLVEIPSVLSAYDESSDTPFGKPIDDALKTMLEMAEEDGFVALNVDNHAAHIEWGEGKEVLGILTHLDVVPAKGAWTRPPFEPYLKDGKIYGRGTMDDKGPTIAAYFAMKLLRASGFTPKKRIRLILGLDEETANRGIERYFSKEPMPDAGFSPDAEFPVIHGEKGLFSFDFEGKAMPGSLLHFHSGERYNVVPAKATAVIEDSLDLSESFNQYLKSHGLKGNVQGNTYVLEGKSAHASTPEKGVNGAVHLALFLSEHIDHPYINLIANVFAFDHYGELTGIASNDDLLEALTLNPAVFRYSKEGALIGLNVRYPYSFDIEKAHHTLSKLAYKYHLKYKSKGRVSPHYVDSDDSLVTTLMEAYKHVTSDYDNPPFTIGGGTYARTLEKGVAFGLVMPGREDVAHQIDEHIFIDDFLKATAIYMEAIENLTNTENTLK